MGEFRTPFTIASANDAMVVSSVPKQRAKEKAPMTIDSGLYIYIEDKPIRNLIMTSSAPNVISISGRSLTLLVLKYIEPRIVTFNATDALIPIGREIPIEVVKVNDRSVLLSIDGRPVIEPATGEVPEGGVDWFSVEATDVGSSPLHYYASSSLGGIEMLDNGTLKVSPAHGDVGTFWASITVDDLDGGTAEANITIEVRNVNDPPTVPKITSPLNGTIFEEEMPVTFSCTWSDPDIAFGQVLTIVWRSNVTGVLAELTSANATSFSLNNFTPGQYLITVTVSDGTYERSLSVDIGISAKSKPIPPNGHNNDDVNRMKVETIVIVVVLVIIISMIIGFVRIRKNKGA